MRHGGAFHIDPVCADADAVDPGVGWSGLGAIAHGALGCPSGVGEAIESTILSAVNAGVFRAGGGLPGGLHRGIQDIRRRDIGGELRVELVIGRLRGRVERGGQQIGLLIGIGADLMKALGVVIEADELEIAHAHRASAICRCDGRS